MIKIVENEVKKYLVTCEIIIKYYLNQIGYLPELIYNRKNKSSNDNSDDFLFKIDYLKYLFQGINNSEIFNNINVFEEERKEEEIILNTPSKEEEEQLKNQEESNKKEISILKQENMKSSLDENNKLNETKSNLNKTNNISHSGKSKSH